MEELPPERCRSCSRTFEDRVGELGIRVILDSKTSLDQARTAANGWEDDWLQFWESATQREVLWRVHLTTPTDAHELASAWSTALQNEKVMAMRKESSSVRWTFDGPWATTYSGSVEGRMFTFRIVSNEPPG